MRQSIQIRSTGVTIIDVLKALAIGHTPSQVLAQHPQLTLPDIMASLKIATNLMEHYVTSEGLIKIESQISVTAKNSRIVNVSKMRETHPRAYEPWRRNEIDALINMFERGESFEEIAKTLGRGKGAIIARLEKLGLINRQKDD